MLVILEYAAWGLFGGFAVEAIEFIGAIRRSGGWPWRNRDGTRNLAEPAPVPQLIAVSLRLGVSSGLAAVATASEQINTPLAAMAVGVAAPLIIERMGTSDALPMPMPSPPITQDRSHVDGT
jgi:hypothetical protein